MNGCSNWARPFECWSSRLDIYLCTDECRCDFPATTPRPTTTTTLAPSTTTTTTTTAPQCVLAVRQAPAWTTTIQRQPPVAIVDPFGSGNVVALPNNGTQMPWYRNPDSLRRLLLASIGATAKGADPDKSYWDNGANQTVMFSENSAARFILLSTAPAVNIQRVQVYDGPVSQMLGVPVVQYGTSGLNFAVYFLGDKCKTYRQVCTYVITLRKKRY